MHFKALLLLLGLGKMSLATITLGTAYITGEGTYNVAWIDGEYPCYTARVINNNGQNPCGIDFTLDNGYTYQLAYCGTNSFALLNGDGSYNHKCSSVKSVHFNCDYLSIDSTYDC